MKRSRPRPFSRRREDERAERAELVTRVLNRDKHRCQGRVLFPDLPCASAVLDPHEIISRAVWRQGYLVEDNVLSLCRRPHHALVDDQPILAECAGLRVPRHAFDLYGPDRALQIAATLRSLVAVHAPTFPPWLDDEKKQIAAVRDARWARPVPFRWDAAFEEL